MAWRSYKLAPRNISLEKGDLKRLIDYVIQLTSETRTAHAGSINFSELSEVEVARVNSQLDQAYKAAVFIYGNEGEELLVNDSTIFDQPQFPEVVNRITIDTLIPYQFVDNNRSPRNGVRIDLDFSSSQVLDWQNSVSAPTANTSAITIQGQDESYTGGLLRHLQGLFRRRRNFRNALHAPFSYDFYLWLIAVPIYFWGLIAFDDRIDQLLGGVPLPIRIAIYLYSFVVATNVYRLAIGYIRWTFQTVELTDVRTTQRRHRKFWFFLASAILLPIILRLVLPAR